MTDPARAVVLLSGGLDSTTVLAIVRDQGFGAYALSFRYGQRHAAELDAAARIAGVLGAAEHLVLDLGLDAIGGSALTADIGVPKDRAPEAIASEIPITYVPARNTIFLAYGLAWAEVLGADDIFIGVNALDYSGYPDCRPDFIAAFEAVARLATRTGVEGTSRVSIQTPLIAMTKAEIIKTGRALGVDYGLTVSCYDPGGTGRACGECDACQLRLKGFAEAGLTDPIAYETVAAAGP